MEEERKLIIFFACILTLFPRPGFAYLDPGSGSYILQLLIAALMGGLFGIKVFWKKIFGFFRKDEKQESSEE